MTFFIHLGFLTIVIGIVITLLLAIVNFVPLNLIEDALTTAQPYWGTANIILPVTTVLGLVGSFVILETALFVYTILRWVWSKVPGLN